MHPAHRPRNAPSRRSRYSAAGMSRDTIRRPSGRRARMDTRSSGSRRDLLVRWQPDDLLQGRAQSRPDLGDLLVETLGSVLGAQLDPPVKVVLPDDRSRVVDHPRLLVKVWVSPRRTLPQVRRRGWRVLGAVGTSPIPRLPQATARWSPPWSQPKGPRRSLGGGGNAGNRTMRSSAEDDDRAAADSRCVPGRRRRGHPGEPRRPAPHRHRSGGPSRPETRRAASRSHASRTQWNRREGRRSPGRPSRAEPRPARSRKPGCLGVSPIGGHLAGLPGQGTGPLRGGNEVARIVDPTQSFG